MSKWDNWILTQKGQALMAKVNAGLCKLEFKHLGLGDGYPSDLANAESLNNTRLMLDITNLEVIDKTLCRVDASVNNSELTEEFPISEQGLFAIDPDEGEILFGISVDESPDIMPLPGGALSYSHTYRIHIIVADTTNVTVIIDPGAFVTYAALERAIAEINTNTETTVTQAVEDLTVTIDKTVVEHIEYQYSQVTKLDVATLCGLLIPVEATTDFRRPPLEILKLRDDGISTTVTACEFNDGDASDFQPNEKVEFSNGTMHLKTSFDVAMSVPTEFSIGHISESAEIDLSEYVLVSEVKIA